MFAKILSKEHPGGVLSKAFTFDWTVTGGLLKVLMFQRQPSENILQKISSSYRKVPNAILWNNMPPVKSCHFGFTIHFIAFLQNLYNTVLPHQTNQILHGSYSVV